MDTLIPRNNQQRMGVRLTLSPKGNGQVTAGTLVGNGSNQVQNNFTSNGKTGVQQTPLGERPYQSPDNRDLLTI